MVLWLGLSLLSSISKHNMWSYYGWVCVRCRLSVNIQCGRIMIGFIVVSKQNMSLSLSVSKHIKWWFYGWVFVVIVNTICSRVMIWFIVVVRQ